MQHTVVWRRSGVKFLGPTSILIRAHLAKQQEVVDCLGASALFHLFSVGSIFFFQHSKKDLLPFGIEDPIRELQIKKGTILKTRQAMFTAAEAFDKIRTATGVTDADVRACLLPPPRPFFANSLALRQHKLNFPFPG